jgi:hypothetical protein
MAADVRGLFASGHLLFMRDGLLFAQPLDLQALRLTGEPVRIAERVGFWTAAFGYAAFDASPDGVVAFGPALRVSRLLQTFDRLGNAQGRPLEGPFTAPRLAPDQQTLAVSAVEAGGADIWVIDLARAIPSRVTSDSASERAPVWLPDGRHVLFASSRAPSATGATAIYRTSVGGRDADEPVNADSQVPGYPNDVSPGGEFVLFQHQLLNGYDLSAASLEPGGTPIDFLSTPFNELQARFSPDGRWVAYASDESGRFEVYLRAWPSASDRTPVSVGGGMQPEWRRDGKELFYLSADRRIMAVPIALDGKAVVVGKPQPLFSVDVAEPVAPYPNDYAVSADGQRFVVTLVAKPQTPQALTILYNWTSSLRR